MRGLLPYILFGLSFIICFSCSETLTSNESTAENNSRPNIVFIEVDDLTAKYLGSFGAQHPKTPHIDSLAANGVVFENAVVQGTMCSPSRNSLVTGLYPSNLGLFENLDLRALPQGIWTFPKALQNEGYTTMWVGKNHLIPYTVYDPETNSVAWRNQALQHEMGFDDVYQSMGRSMVLKIAHEELEGKGYWGKGKDAYGDFLEENDLFDCFVQEGEQIPTTLDPDTEVMDGHFTSIAIEKMASYREEEPFFMWINFSGPHRPFNVPAEYTRKVGFRHVPEAITTSCEAYEVPKELKPSLVPEWVSDMRGYRRRYMGALAYMDDQVGRIIDFIRNSNFGKNTIIVFFSDHGIMTGDHGLTGKSTLYKEVLNPALIVNYPEKYKAKRVKTTVELLDLGKTVLDIAEANEQILNDVPNGNSLVPILEDEGTFMGNGIGISEIKGIQSAFNGQFKYINHPETPILFDLKNDPNETVNVISKYPEVANQLNEMIEEWKISSGPVLNQ